MQECCLASLIFSLKNELLANSIITGPLKVCYLWWKCLSLDTFLFCCSWTGKFYLLDEVIRLLASEWVKWSLSRVLHMQWINELKQVIGALEKIAGMRLCILVMGCKCEDLSCLQMRIQQLPIKHISKYKLSLPMQSSSSDHENTVYKCQHTILPTKFFIVRFGMPYEEFMYNVYSWAPGTIYMYA